jgi:hypothetical protein
VAAAELFACGLLGADELRVARAEALELEAGGRPAPPEG